jgi:hypothetical protein
VENGITINNNLSANQIDQHFVTLRKFFQSKQKHLWTKETHASHKTLQASSIIPCELQIGEA